ncbi:zinc finger protein 182 isoform X2 [Tribolium castaneum]|uniref:C2H2-type domain-containing protein n=1 Tax=Tribolium castaneum TaxID=7070 RepID=D2A4R7_TRICA|nr:PREDICTED: zinc finger protein 182 isoform X2 [Tribolium castaneum]EFA05258.2 hypothetical protein TcasGA2_TC015411 [Tribolium castaneum]|eukprot:XP_008194493.1 PREDICTED: zinc finger protein 182 isoform X2 [Tribolium castaneum]
MCHKPAKRQNAHLPGRGPQNPAPNKNPKLSLPHCLRERLFTQSRLLQMPPNARSLLFVPARVRQFREHALKLFQKFQVYIKDTATKTAPPEPPTFTEVKPVENVPFYTLQLPAIVTNQPVKAEKIAPMMGAIKTAPRNEMSNVVVNANGEVLNIAQLVDFESLINQAGLQQQKKCVTKATKKDKEDPIIKIDLTTTSESNYDTGQKNKNPNKFAYAIKVEEKLNNPSVIFNNLPEFNQNAAFNGYNNSLYTPGVVATPSVVCNTVEPSTVNLNVLSQDLNQPAAQPYQHKVVAEEMAPTQVNNNNQIIKSHVCEICQKSFKRREHLYQHVKLHTGFRPYTCENCNKSFMRKEHLLRHMTSHSGQKNFTCNICDKSFSRNDNLLKHKKTHDKQASYTCDICQKQFVMKHYYLAHKLTHDSDRCSLANVWNVLKT